MIWRHQKSGLQAWQLGETSQVWRMLCRWQLSRGHQSARVAGRQTIDADGETSGSGVSLYGKLAPEEGRVRLRFRGNRP